MSYIGNTQQNQSYVPAVDFFNGDGSTVAFTLSRTVASVAAIQVVVSNVSQKPGDAYMVSGSTITFTSAPPSGTNNIYVYYTSPNNYVMEPGQGTVSTDKIADGAVTASKMASSGLSASAMTTGTLPKAQLPAGTVLQVINATLPVEYQTTSTSYVDVGISGVISPLYATSKVLMIISVAGCFKNTADGYGKMQVLRGSTVLHKVEGAYGYTNSAGESNLGASSISYLDSPASTTAVTYKIQIASSGGGTNVGVGRNLATSSITLMEIAA